MADGQRVYPVNNFVVHHTGTNDTDMVGWSDIDVQDWFDRVGKQHGYDPAGVGRSYHDHPQRNKETFSQYQIALVPNGNADDPNTDWRIVHLMRDIWNNVAWGAGNWAINQRAINVCIAGNRVGRPLNRKALFRLAEFWAGQDKALKGDTIVNAHGWITATACPGSPKDQVLPTLIPYINNIEAARKDAYPTVDVKPEWNGNKHEVSMLFAMKNSIPMYDLLTGKKIADSGLAIHITRKSDLGAWKFGGVGHTVYLPIDRVENNQDYGFTEKDLYDNLEKVKEPAIDPQPKWLVTTGKEGEAHSVVYSGTDEQEARKLFNEGKPTTENPIVELTRDGVLVEHKEYEAPEITYRVLRADDNAVEKELFKGIDEEIARSVYDDTMPTRAYPTVILRKNEDMVVAKWWIEPEQPSGSLYDFVIGLINKAAEWLKLWKRG